MALLFSLLWMAPLYPASIQFDLAPGFEFEDGLPTWDGDEAPMEYLSWLEMVPCEFSDDCAATLRKHDQMRIRVLWYLDVISAANRHHYRAMLIKGEDTTDVASYTGIGGTGTADFMTLDLPMEADRVLHLCVLAGGRQADGAKEPQVIDGGQSVREGTDYVWHVKARKSALRRLVIHP